MLPKGSLKRQIVLLKESQAYIESQAINMPAEDGRVFNDEIVLNAILSGKSPDEISKELNLKNPTMYKRTVKGIQYYCKKCKTSIETQQEFEHHSCVPKEEEPQPDYLNEWFGGEKNG